MGELAPASAPVKRLSECCAARLRNKGYGRYCCTTCGKYARNLLTERQSRIGVITRDKRGRARINLGVGHEYANSGGWQYLGRYRVMVELGRRLATREHTHHIEGVAFDGLTELEVLDTSYHGRLHASAVTLAGWRDELGRFVEHPKWPEYDWQRRKAVMGPAAKEERW